jgi:hypothetical protein
MIRFWGEDQPEKEKQNLKSENLVNGLDSEKRAANLKQAASSSSCTAWQYMLYPVEQTSGSFRVKLSQPPSKINGMHVRSRSGDAPDDLQAQAYHDIRLEDRKGKRVLSNELIVVFLVSIPDHPACVPDHGAISAQFYIFHPFSPPCSVMITPVHYLFLRLMQTQAGELVR